MGKGIMVSKNDNIIYGVDVTKNVTPVMVRDAIIQCFYEAHCNILELARETFGHPPEEKFEEMKINYRKKMLNKRKNKIKNKSIEKKEKGLKKNRIMELIEIKEYRIKRYRANN